MIDPETRFRRLWAEVQGVVLATIRYRGRYFNDSEREDAILNVKLRLWRVLGTIDMERAGSLARVATERECIDIQNTTAYRERYGSVPLDAQFAQAFMGNTIPYVDILSAAEVDGAISLGRLTETQERNLRAVAAGHSLPEIAEAGGVTPESVFASAKQAARKVNARAENLETFGQRVVYAELVRRRGRPRGGRGGKG